MMFLNTSIISLLLLFLGFFATVNSFLYKELEIKAHTGTYIGFINGTSPHVRQFHNVPYALPPVGSRRWLPAEAPPSNEYTIFESTTFPHLCPQYLSGAANLYNQMLPGYLIPTGLNTSAPATMPPTAAEDCLSLSIWTPTGKVSGLPVIIFMTGGNDQD